MHVCLGCADLRAARRTCRCLGPVATCLPWAQQLIVLHASSQRADSANPVLQGRTMRWWLSLHNRPWPAWGSICP